MRGCGQKLGYRQAALTVCLALSITFTSVLIITKTIFLFLDNNIYSVVIITLVGVTQDCGQKIGYRQAALTACLVLSLTFTLVLTINKTIFCLEITIFVCYYYNSGRCNAGL